MGMTLDDHVDHFDSTCAGFNEQALAAVREEAFNQDIGQNNWLTAEKCERFIGWLNIGKTP
jgi:hypothetical protein